MDELLTAAEVAQILKVSRSLVYRLHAEGSLRAHYKILPGKKGTRWSRRDLDDYIKRMTLPEFVPIESAGDFVESKRNVLTLATSS